MHTHQPLFARLRSDIANDRDPAATTARIARWAETEPTLAGLVSVADIMAACCVGSGSDRAPGVLAVLVRIAGEDPQAGRIVLGALCEGLSEVGRGLVRRWGADGEEVDQALAAAAWARIIALAGRDVYDPAAAIVGGARDEVRGQLRRQAGHRQPPIDQLPLGQLALLATPPADQGVEVAEWFASAVRHNVVSLDEARLVVSTRALGVSPTELGRLIHQRPATLRMRRHRAEAALRAIA